MAVARAAATGGAASARVAALLRDHRGTLLWIARRWSGSADDAEDALQRALEIYVRRLDTVDPATELAWLKVVVRHEAMAIRRARADGVPLDALDVAERVPAPDVAVQERIEREERLAYSREALARLKPDERTALLLKAEGFSYREIGDRLNWTYTKVNRAITEGRRRFLDVFAGIEAGEECERYQPTLLALATGEAASADVVALRPHLRHCAACRATVRELHASRLHRLALHLPLLAGVAPVRWLGDRVADGSRPRGVDLKAAAQGMLHRVTGSDPATSFQLASSSGGGRGTAVAALLSLCLGGGAGSYCIVTGGLPDPTRLVQRAEPEEEPRERPSRRRVERPVPTRTPTATVVPAPAPRTPATAAAASPSQRAKPREQRQPARREESERADPSAEFGFESATAGGDGAAAAPAAAPPAATTATTSSPSPPASSAPSSSPPPTSGGEFLP